MMVFWKRSFLEGTELVQHQGYHQSMTSLLYIGHSDRILCHHLIPITSGECEGHIQEDNSGIWAFLQSFDLSQGDPEDRD